MQQRGISSNFTGTILHIPPSASLFPFLSLPLSPPSLSQCLPLSLSIFLPPPPSLSSVPLCLSRRFAGNDVEFRQTSQERSFLSVPSICLHLPSRSFPPFPFPLPYPSSSNSLSQLPLPPPPSIPTISLPLHHPLPPSNSPSHSVVLF